MVTHDIASVFTVADRVLYLDDQLMTMTALGTPQDLLLQGPAAVRRFLAPQGAVAPHLKPEEQTQGARP
jgi:phospholipid/cholesterol/gamma-HCH transport system ATP-binding protein